MSKKRRKKKASNKMMPADPRSLKGQVQREVLKECAAEKFNDLFRASRDPVVEPRLGEEIDPYEGEKVS